MYASKQRSVSAWVSSVEKKWRRRKKKVEVRGSTLQGEKPCRKVQVNAALSRDVAWKWPVTGEKLILCVSEFLELYNTTL